MKAKLIKGSDGRFKLLVDGEIFGLIMEIDPYSGQSGIHKLSLKNCQAIERDYDLEQMAEDVLKSHKDFNTEGFSDYQNGRLNGIYEGFQKALELIGDKKFTEEDLSSAMNWIMSQYFEFHEQPTTGRREEYIQSLQQNEWDVEIEMKTIQTTYRDGTIETDTFPKLDADGNLILKRQK